MYKKISCILIMLISIFHFKSFAFADTPLIVDECNILNDNEISMLSQKAEAISSTYGIDTAIYITKTFNNVKDSLFADDYWAKADYSDSCSILIVATDDRNYYLYNCGYASDAITDYGSNYIDKKVVPYLSKDDYYKAGLNFLIYSSEFYNEYFLTGEAYDIDNKADIIKMLSIELLSCSGFGFILSLIILNSKKNKMKTVQYENNANRYSSFNSFELIFKDDHFIDRHIITTPLPKNNTPPQNGSGIGGTTIHTGTTGHSFSGHGGKF